MSRRLVLAVVVASAFCGGCRSPSQYVSPRITGRVVDAGSSQPIAEAEVWRVKAAARTSDTPKGATQLRGTVRAITGEDGTFVLESERALAFLRHVHWYSVTVSFAHAGYETLERTYSLNDTTNAPDGEPIVLTGDVRLNPAK